MDVVNYKVLLDDNKEINISEHILVNIPLVKEIIDEINKNEIKQQKIIDLQNIDYTIFSHIITMIKFQLVNDNVNSNTFNKTLISNMNINTLFDFIFVTNILNLDSQKTMASDRFLSIFRNNSEDYVKTIFKLPDDIPPNDKKLIQQEYEWIDEGNH